MRAHIHPSFSSDGRSRVAESCRHFSFLVVRFCGFFAPIRFPSRERGRESEEAEEGMHNFSQQQHMSSPPAPSRASCPPRRLSPRARPRRRRRVARCPHFPPPPRIVNGWGTDGDNISLGRAEGRQERGRGGGTEGEERSNGPETTRADWMTTSEREGAGK